LISSIFPFDPNRLGSLKILSWVVVWSRWYRTRQIQLSFYTVLTGAQNLQETEIVCTFSFSSYPWISLLLIVQFMLRMEVHISIARRSWSWDMGFWHSWLGFLWSRFVSLLFLCYFIPFSLHFNHAAFFLYPPEKLPSCDVVSKREHFYQVHVC
jgi:hypothetical protein